MGESGCGKTTTSPLHPPGDHAHRGRGQIRSESGEILDVGTLPKTRLQSLRREMQMIFQEPFASSTRG